MGMAAVRELVLVAAPDILHRKRNKKRCSHHFHSKVFRTTHRRKCRQGPNRNNLGLA
jgi:hypothetical protein